MFHPPSIIAIFDIGSSEIVLIMLVVLLLFGSKRMPELARGIGKSIREFKKATSGLEAEIKRAMEEPPPSPKPPAAPAAGHPPSADKPPHSQPQGPEEPFHYP